MLLFLQVENLVLHMKNNISFQHNQFRVGRGSMFGKNGVFLQADTQYFKHISLYNFLYFMLVERLEGYGIVYGIHFFFIELVGS
jgi:hypothetical protein